MPEATVPCGLCGRAFEPRGGGPPKYCPKCMAWADGEVAGTHRLRCRECGGGFQTPRRSVKYCSDACREKGRLRRARAGAQRRRRGSAGARERGGTADKAAGAARSGAAAPPAPACRVCGKGLATSRQRAYCSAECRTEGKRARKREYVRRYLEDPERRAVQAARMRAAYVRRMARKRDG